VHNEAPQVDRRPFELEAAVLEPCREEQVGDEREQPFGVPPDDREMAQLLRVLFLFLQQLDVAGDRRQWRAQLVRDARDELVLQPVDLDELLVLERQELLRLLGLTSREPLGEPRSLDGVHETGETEQDDSAERSTTERDHKGMDAVMRRALDQERQRSGQRRAGE